MMMMMMMMLSTVAERVEEERVSERMQVVFSFFLFSGLP
jgi:hypothetical protein